MAEITTLDGPAIEVSNGAIVMIAGPRPDDVGPHIYVHGVTPAPLVTGEAPEVLVNRLKVNPPWRD